ncbi:hypothetical protein BDI4_530024 [Burkholderia diffusa]|nr:hypothetical protein BDI4_530024 [Burkholderia diffusa]
MDRTRCTANDSTAKRRRRRAHACAGVSMARAGDAPFATCDGQIGRWLRSHDALRPDAAVIQAALPYPRGRHVCVARGRCPDLRSCRAASRCRVRRAVGHCYVILIKCFGRASGFAGTCVVGGSAGIRGVRRVRGLSGIGGIRHTGKRSRSTRTDAAAAAPAVVGRGGEERNRACDRHAQALHAGSRAAPERARERAARVWRSPSERARRCGSRRSGRRIRCARRPCAKRSGAVHLLPRDVVQCVVDDRRVAGRHRLARQIRSLPDAARRVPPLARQHGFPRGRHDERQRHSRLRQARHAHLRLRLGGRRAGVGQGRQVADALPDARDRPRSPRAAARHPAFERLRADSRIAEHVPRHARHPRRRLSGARRGRQVVVGVAPRSRHHADRRPLPGRDRQRAQDASGMVAGAGAQRMVEAAEERRHGGLTTAGPTGAIRRVRQFDALAATLATTLAAA